LEAAARLKALVERARRKADALLSNMGRLSTGDIRPVRWGTDAASAL